MALIDNPVSSIIDLVKDGIDKFIPDATQKAQLTAQLDTLRENNEFQTQMGQLAIDLQDAKSASRFQSWWRPALAWSCLLDVVYETIGYPILHAYFPGILTANAIGICMPILLTLIGARSVDKWQGTATK